MRLLLTLENVPYAAHETEAYTVRIKSKMNNENSCSMEMSEKLCFTTHKGHNQHDCSER
jgi:hypothetical protein